MMFITEELITKHSEEIEASGTRISILIRTLRRKHVRIMYK